MEKMKRFFKGLLFIVLGTIGLTLAVIGFLILMLGMLIIDLTDFFDQGE